MVKSVLMFAGARLRHVPCRKWGHAPAAWDAYAKTFGCPEGEPGKTPCNRYLNKCAETLDVAPLSLQTTIRHNSTPPLAGVPGTPAVTKKGPGREFRGLG